MKGIVFTELTSLIEERFGLETLDKILYSPNVNLESEGVYTAVATYSHKELVAIVSELSNVTQIPIPEILKSFGKYLFSVFEKSHGTLFRGINGTLDFLEKVENYIHVEVQKLYPDAELPTLDQKRIGANCLVVTYYSRRKLSDFAEGLMLGCADFFGEKLKIEKEDLSNGEGTEVRFTITKL